MTRLDLAAVDDIGWQVSYPDAVVIDSLTHIYGDDADYNVEVIVRGSVFGEVRRTIVAEIDNVAPTLTVPATQTVIAGESLPSLLFEISDPGYGTSGTDPATSETFTYSIDWKDGTELDAGVANITQVGNDSRDTTASFTATHTYDTVGNYQVAVTVTDDDGAAASKNFTVQVVEPPALKLSLSSSQVAENAGNDAATLTVTRSGPVRDTNQTITLSSSDTSEATVPDSVVIPAGQSSLSVGVDAVDDALLDGTQSVTLTAAGSGVASAEIELNVTDVESLQAEVSAAGVLENDPSSLVLTVTRSNSDQDDSLRITVSGGDASELDMPDTLVIEAGENLVAIVVKPIDDDQPEPTQRLAFTFSATNYESTSIEFDLFDDEPPLFQNPVDPFDVDGRGGLTAGDALRVINVIGQRQGSKNLNPQTEQPDGVYVDANGDYKVTALDALLIINEIARRLLDAEESEFLLTSRDLLIASPRASSSLDDDTLTILALDPGLKF